MSPVEARTRTVRPVGERTWARRVRASTIFLTYFKEKSFISLFVFNTKLTFFKTGQSSISNRAFQKNYSLRFAVFIS